MAFKINFKILQLKHIKKITEKTIFHEIQTLHHYKLHEVPHLKFLQSSLISAAQNKSKTYIPKYGRVKY